MLNFLKKDEPLRIEFFLSPETNKQRFTVFDQITMERYQNGNASNERFYILMSHFMVDRDNQFLGEERGMKLLEKLNSEQAAETVKKFLERFQEAAVNPMNGNGSTPASEAGSKETFPGGSQS